MSTMAILAVLLVSCVSQEELDRVSAERDTLHAQVTDLKAKIKEIERTKQRCQTALEDIERESEQADQRQEVATTLALAEGQTLAADFHTSLGKIHCELWPDIAPVTVTNFVQLSEGTKEWTHPATREKHTTPLYNGTKFHRVIENFMIQGGDPLGTGRGGPGYRFQDEVHRDVQFDKPGLLAMANSGPATNGSQFFITDSTPTHLNMKHTIFGACDLNTVRKIISTPVKGSTPIDDVIIDHIAITRN